MNYPIRTRGRAALFVGSIVVAGGCGGTVENGGSRAGGGGAQTSSTSGSTTSSTGASVTSASGTGSATATGTGPSTTGPSTTSSAATAGSGGSGGNGTGGGAGGGGGGGGSGAGGGGAGAGGANARDAGSRGGASGVDAGNGGGGGSLASVQQLCVDTINMYRATLGLAPYARWTAEETCGNGQAQSDSQTGTAHGAFGMCTESAQNECPGWPAPPETMIIGCLQAMWNEGPGADFNTHGHYINMSSTQYRQVACGFYTTAAGRIWSVQDFK
jgi:hypothetical protein